MRPRLISRTHYQVDEPAYLELLVKECTSPTQSAYDETVADRLARSIKKRGKKFNVAAGGYALDLARGLGLVNQQNGWSDKGHLVNLVAEVGSESIDDELFLNMAERLLHFRLFLDGDGAALLFIGRSLLDEGSLPNGNDGWNTLATSMFIETLSACLKMAGTTSDRVALRTELDRVKANRYKGKTGSHKMFIHLQALYRMGLVDRADAGNGRIYKLATDDQRTSVAALVDAVPDLYALERVVSANEWASIASRVFARDGSPSESVDEDSVIRLLAPSYRRVIATGVAQCHLSTLIDALVIERMASGSEFVSFEAVLSALQKAQRRQPADIRFHVDRRGRPAFLKLSDAVLDGGSTAKDAS